MKIKKSKVRMPLEDCDISITDGLSPEQVNERVEKGYVNDVKISSSKSYPKIVFGNIFTFFNLLCLLICIWLITVIDSGSDIKNLTFMVIIAMNTLIGIAQEIKAKRTIDKITLLSSPDVKVIRGKEEVDVKLNALLKNDIMHLSTGCQICSDCIIRQGAVEVNEALLTGESMSVKKAVGDTLMSGSFIVSGKCFAEVTNIAEENYIQQLAKEAKAFKKVESELMRSVKVIMKVIGIIVIPIGILSFLTNWNASLQELNVVGDGMFASLGNLDMFTSSQLYEAYRAAVTPTSTALIGVIPTGLVLLISIALAVGVVRLYKQNALAQQLYSIETLARVDTLCLDKTGTITDGTMEVDSVVSLGTCGAQELKDIIASMQFALGEDNLTARALISYAGALEVHKAKYIVPFTSERKCSAVQLDDGMYILGAPEFVAQSLPCDISNKIDSLAAEGNRCLLLACHMGHVEQSDSCAIPKDGLPLAIVVIHDNVKCDARDTIAYFVQNDVDVKVISGDNPITVSNVAKRVGIPNADKYINLYGMSDMDVVKSCMEHTVFGRVSPEQKKLLVATLKSNGRTVAMTGDGINDILALKEADCSIAMANGSEATRSVAQIVLLDSNFASMPKVVSEGRRVVNNIQRASTLFLTKTVFSVILQLILVFMGEALPLEPIQLSFISFFCIGIPSFVLALEPNNKRIEGKFLSNVMKKVIPSSIAVAINVSIIMILCVSTNIVNLPDSMLNTMVMVSIYSVFMQILYSICKPFNANRFVMYAATGVWAVLCIICMPYAGSGIMNLFNIVHLNDIVAVLMIFALMLVSQTVIKLLSTLIDKLKWSNNKLTLDFDAKEFFSKLFKN